MTDTLELEDILDSSKGLINSIINRYKYYYEYDDLYQVATIGVIKAYKRFDSSKNIKFSTFAYTYILGEVIKFANDNKGIKAGSNYKILGRKIEEARTILTQKLMKVPNNKELSDFIGVPEAVIDDVTLSNIKLESLDKTIAEDGKELTLLDTVASTSNIPDDENIMLHSAISELTKQEQEIINLTYFKDYTQERVANTVGMSQVQISRNLTKSKNKLRKILIKS